MGLTWLAIGDSITNGTGASTYDKSYVYTTRQGLLNSGKKHQLIRASFGGITSGGMLANNKYKILGGVCDPDLVTILLGTNDIAQSVSTATYQANLETLIDNIRNSSQTGQCKIVLLTVLWRPDFAATVPTFNAIVQQVATNKNVSVCDTYPAFNTAGDLSDGVHPTDSGHSKVANILIPYLNNLDIWSKTRTR
jgi:lysophospholipase L1-like esterase